MEERYIEKVHKGHFDVLCHSAYMLKWIWWYSGLICQLCPPFDFICIDDIKGFVPVWHFHTWTWCPLIGFTSLSPVSVETKGSPEWVKFWVNVYCGHGESHAKDSEVLEPLGIGKDLCHMSKVWKGKASLRSLLHAFMQDWPDMQRREAIASAFQMFTACYCSLWTPPTQTGAPHLLGCP